MRLGWVGLPLLIAVEACSPVRNVQAAARSLRFTLDRVEPSLQLALPLDRSRLFFLISVGVDNPSTTPFHLKAFSGDLRLETDGGPQPVGHLELVRALELPAGGRAELVLEVSFVYKDLRDQWAPLQAALRPGASGAWSLEGELNLDAYGFSWQLPVRTRRTFGSPP